MKWFIGLVVVLFAAAVGAYFVAASYLKPVNPDSQESIYFVVRSGQGVASVAEGLYEKGLIKHPYAFRYAVLRAGNNAVVQAGGFKLSPSMTPQEIVEALSHGKFDVWVRITEGLRREEIATIIAEAVTEAGGKFDEKIFLAETKGKEGFLFPDTYLFPLTADEKSIASVLLNTFDKKITSDMKSDLSKAGRTLAEVVTMASIIEKEAREDADRAIVSGILWKRIAEDWPLQVDATLQYAKGYDTVTQSWWKPPVGADKEIKSPYNTYQNKGLPPGPIASPSLSSIKAAIYPKDSEYWFYISDNQKGDMHYAATLAEHEQNIATYLR